MKKIFYVLLLVTAVTTLGFVTINPYTKKIEALQKQIETMQATSTCSIDKVLDKDLASYIKNNAQNPSLNAVKVTVKNLRQALADYKGSDNVYITIADTYSLGRNVTIIGDAALNLEGVCHAQGGGRICCPPPLNCDSGLINHVQYFKPEAFLKSPDTFNYDPVKAEQ